MFQVRAALSWLSATASPLVLKRDLGRDLRRTLFVAVFAGLAGAGCSDIPEVRPSPSPPTSALPITPASPPPPVPGYLATYSPDQQAQYAAAVVAYASYSGQEGQLEAAGKTTTAAKNFYEKYAVDWAASWSNLAQLANNGVTVTGSVVVKSTRPVSIVRQENDDVVTLSQCLDQTRLVVTQDKKVVDQPQFAHPHLVQVQMEKRDGESWWRSSVSKQGATC